MPHRKLQVTTAVIPWKLSDQLIIGWFVTSTEAHSNMEHNCSVSHVEASLMHTGFAATVDGVHFVNTRTLWSQQLFLLEPATPTIIRDTRCSYIPEMYSALGDQQTANPSSFYSIHLLKTTATSAVIETTYLKGKMFYTRARTGLLHILKSQHI